MNARRRMALALRAEPTDRPALAYLFLGGARHVLGRMGARLGAVYRDAERIAEAQFVAADLFGHDTGMVPWGCLTVEAEAFGCRLEWEEDYYPRVVGRPLEENRDLGRLSDPDPSRSGRMPLVLEALAALRRRAGDDLFVVGMVVSPFLVAAELRGMVGLLSDFIADPPYAEALLERVTDGIARYVGALLGTGACDAVLFENAGACRELMGPHHVGRYVMPFQRRLLAAARRVSPDVFLIEHNCSKTPYFAEILELDVDAVSFAHGDVRAIRSRHEWDCHATHTVTNACLERHCLRPAAGRRIAWIGNVDNTRVMLEARPEEVLREARACIASAAGAPFVLSTSCEIPFKAPIGNILALAQAVADPLPPDAP
ncbi:MAG TPA: uroporphyrinogen decarboxylase family protein [Candidatus Polarisedimenticolia bacterium]|nr:uroporphyrinogen decarboxylase family protein [Candidatus Polarisedimenticolia bacterium]